MTDTYEYCCDQFVKGAEQKRYGVGDCGMLQMECSSKEEALKEISKRADAERKRHEAHPDWSWACYHLMVDDGNGWRIAKRWEYD